MLRYHGGKARSAPWIISHFPRHRVYVEPFGGAASVLLQKPRSHSEVLNDLDDEIVNVYRVMRDKPRSLERACTLTPFARTELARAYLPVKDPVERARRTIVKAFFGFGSDAIFQNGMRGFRVRPSRQGLTRGTGFRRWCKLSGASPATDWARWPDAIEFFAERLRGVTIECRPAFDLIPLLDYEDALFYVDPPYVRSLRGSADRNGYRHEMTDDDHRALARMLHARKGMVFVSGYAGDLYDRELYPDWTRKEKEVYADGARPRTEVLWCNDAAVRRLEPSLFDQEIQ